MSKFGELVIQSYRDTNQNEKNLNNNSFFIFTKEQKNPRLAYSLRV